jgi:hypothetical protein
MGCRVRGSTGRVRRPARGPSGDRSRRRASRGDAAAVARASLHAHLSPAHERQGGRFIQTLLGEWAYARGYRSSTDRARALWSYLRWYNRRRAHSSLRARPPISRVSHLYGHAS